MGLWLAVPVYWLVLLAAHRRKNAYALPFRFLEGVCLAFVSFSFLPSVFLKGVALAGLGATLGILSGIFLEQKLWGLGWRREVYVAIIFTLFFPVVRLAIPFVLLQGIFGGLGLYAASSGLLPEGGKVEEMIPTAVGGVLGFLVGAWFCIF